MLAMLALHPKENLSRKDEITGLMPRPILTALIQKLSRRKSPEEDLHPSTGSGPLLGPGAVLPRLLPDTGLVLPDIALLLVDVMFNGGVLLPPPQDAVDPLHLLHAGIDHLLYIVRVEDVPHPVLHAAEATVQVDAEGILVAHPHVGAPHRDQKLEVDSAARRDVVVRVLAARLHVGCGVSVPLANATPQMRSAE